MIRVPGQDAAIEGARLALTQGRNLFGEGHGAQLTDLLLGKFTDPIAGIIGGHLLLQAMDTSQPDPGRAKQLDLVVSNLRSLLGPDHPDVEALSLRCTGEALRATRPFTAPPMFRHSWQLITAASYERPELVPTELWQRVHASAALGAFFVWAADERTRAAHAAQLSRWISQYADNGEAQTASEEQIANGPAEPSVSTAGADSVRTRSAAAAAAAPALAAPASPPMTVSEPAWQATALPEATREAARKLQVPARAVAALWAERTPPGRTVGAQADV